MRQGRRLLEAAQSANVLAKPLIDFYAATAYAYALIVINSPLHKGLESLKGSHGHSYNHGENSVEFGGEIPRGTFLDLLCATPVQYIYCRNNDTDKDGVINFSLLDSIDLIQQSNIKISLLTLSPKKIVYVSCNCETLARDLVFLSSKYNIDKIQPVDMFPMTHHVESVLLLTIK